MVSIDCDVPGRSARELLLGFSSFSRMNHLHIHGTWTTRFVHSVPDKKLTMARVRFLERGMISVVVLDPFLFTDIQHAQNPVVRLKVMIIFP